jgi:hypothetical protein
MLFWNFDAVVSLRLSTKYQVLIADYGSNS